tara:strand:+ start:430 stop:600 length:171 start_codon:yes stop_codon:yes gene_type:complete
MVLLLRTIKYMSKKEKILAVGMVVLMSGYIMPNSFLSITAFFSGLFLVIAGLIVKD